MMGNDSLVCLHPCEMEPGNPVEQSPATVSCRNSHGQVRSQGATPGGHSRLKDGASGGSTEVDPKAETGDRQCYSGLLPSAWMQK